MLVPEPNDSHSLGKDGEMKMQRVVALLAVALWMMAQGALPGLTATPANVRAAETGEWEAQRDHPLVGVWRWDNDPAHPNTRVTYGMFHADGTYAEISTGAGTAAGVWEATGANTADVTCVFQDLSEDPMVMEPGESIARMTVEVDADGVAHALFTFDVRKLDGEVVFQGGPYEAIGTRLNVEKMVPFDTPADGTPVA